MGSTDKQLREKYDTPLSDIVLPPGLVLDDIIGFCPVMAKGTIDGYPFYFVGRDEHWQCNISPDKQGNPYLVATLIDPVALGCNEQGQVTWESSGRHPGFAHREKYPHGPNSAGYMTRQEVLTCITKSIKLFREQGWKLYGGI
jgi:hypothetical protein